MSKLEVDAIEPQSGTTLTIGASGDTVNIASGATITDFTSTGIDDNATSTAITIDSAENIGIGTASPVSDARLTISSDDSESYVFFERSGSGRFDSAIGMNGTDIVFKGGVNSSTVSGLNEFMRIDSSGNLKFDSGFGSVATAYGVRAWVNFNGTGTVAIRDSGNVSSITDVGTGGYNLSFTNAMPDANYSVAALARETSIGGTVFPRLSNTITTTTLRIFCINLSDTATDPETVTVIVTR